MRIPSIKFLDQPRHRSKWLFLNLTLLFIISIWTSQCWASTYFVRYDGTVTSENKANATSCSSVKTALNVAEHNRCTFKPGDIIYICDDGMSETKTVYGGTEHAYRPSSNGGASFIVPSDGTAESPITYTAAPGDTPLIDQTWLVYGYSWKDTGKKSSFTGNNIYRCTQKNFRSRMLWEDGVPLLPAKNSNLSNGYHFYSGGYNYYSPTSGIPSDHVLESLEWNMGGEGGLVNYSPAGIDIRDRNHIIVEGLSFTRCPTAIHTGHHIKKGNLTDITIRNNTITDTYWAIWGLVDASTDAVISNVTVQGNSISYCNSGISFWVSNGTSGSGHHEDYLITENDILHHGEIVLPSNPYVSATEFTHYFDTADCEAISWQHPKNCVVSKNKIICNMTGDQVTALVASSKINAIRAYYYFQYGGSAAPTEGNIFKHNYIEGPMTAMYSSGRLDIGFQNNVWANNVIINAETKRSDSSFYFNPQGAVQDNPLEGENYFINNSTYYPHGDGRFALSGSYNPGNFTIMNNIFYSAKGIYIFYGAHQNFSADIDYNIHYNHSSNSVQKVSGGGINSVSWASWQKLGMDVNGYNNRNPYYKDPDNGDLALSHSSINAIDQGKDLGSSFSDALINTSSWPASIEIGNQDDYGVGWEIGAYLQAILSAPNNLQVFNYKSSQNKSTPP